VVIGAEILEPTVPELQLPSGPGAIRTERVEVLVQPECIKGHGRIVRVPQFSPSVQDVGLFVESSFDPVLHTLGEARGVRLDGGEDNRREKSYHLSVLGRYERSSLSR
jgi:hypothetical protein